MGLGFISRRLFGSERVAVLILAGGKSARMGKDKRFLIYNNESFILRAYNTARAISKEVYMLISAEEDKSAIRAVVGDSRFIVDQYPGFGPLPALIGGLDKIKANYALLISVDYPLMTDKFLLEMKNYLEKRPPKPEVLLPIYENKPQVTCAFYSVSVLESLEGAYNFGVFSLQKWLKNFDGETAYINEKTWSKWGDSSVLFNVTTPDDYEKLTRMSQKPTGT